VNEVVLLDLYGECRTLGAPHAHAGGLNEALQQCAGKPVRLLTDWGPGVLFGIATVMGTPGTAAALLEKQMRDQGETDDISHILVHQSLARMGSTELAYTAVPIKTWRRYQQLAADRARMVLMHDWIRTILQWARTQKLVNTTLIVLHPKGLDVVVLSHGQVCALERLQTFQEEGNAWERLGQRVVSVVGELDDADRTVPSMLMQSAALLVCGGVEGNLLTIIQGLGPIVVTEMWSDFPDAMRASLPNAMLPIQQLDWAATAQSMPLRQATNPPLDRAAAWADRLAPMVGVASFALACIITLTAGAMHYRTERDLAAISGDTEKTQTLWQTLNTEVQHAEQLNGEQKGLSDWISQRLVNANLPDMSLVLVQVRNALPPGLVIDEVGLVAEKGSHLVTVIGHADAVEDALRSEGAFAEALKNDGFLLQKRDLLLRNGQPSFKLSMTWSAS
jgi:hypothetical protein